MPTIRTTLAIAAVIALTALAAPPARALPSYARQTGQECAACHNGFPELTPYGRLFKLNGYVFPGENSTIPPLAVMEVSSFTHTEAPQVGGAAPHFGPNDNIGFEFASLFYGGAIVPQWGIGGFIQSTYNNVSRRYSWDNTDIRWAHSSMVGDREVVYGVTVNNNPTVTDVWNTTPAWRYPFQSSGLAPTPPTATLIEGGMAGNSLGATTYMFWNRLVYAEVGAYHSLATRAETILGVDATGSNSTDGPALYWRLALEPTWSRHSLEVGTFGLKGSIYPGRVQDFGSDDTTDIGVDSQYQFLANDYSFSLQGSEIFERSTLNSTFAQGGSDFLHSGLNSFHIKGSAGYDQTYAVTLSYFRTSGHADSGLYGAISANNSPNSAGLVGEIDYTPFNHGGPGFWPWANLRIGLQYVAYLEFNGASKNYDGNGANASDNNTVYLFTWLAF
jgi:hypothetical protein